MAIDMTTVKQIMHGNKEVIKIEDSHGVLWQKATAKILQSIVLSGQTTSLNRNAAFSFGGVVTANYSDGSTADVTADTTFSGYDMSTSGTYTVTASYTENGVTQTATYSLTVNPIWTTVYNNSTGYNLRYWANKKWSTTGVPCNISNKATKLRIKYKHVYTYSGKPSGKYVKLVWGNGGTSPVTVTPNNNTTTTTTFTYTQGHDIVYGTYTTSNNWFSTAYNLVSWSWYRNGTWGGSAGSDWNNSNRYSTVIIYKVEEYY